MTKLKLLFPAVALLAFAGVMSAQDIFTWSYDTNNGDAGADSASGTLIANQVSGSSLEWNVDSISGTWISGGGTVTSGSYGITGLITGYGSSNQFYYSNGASSLGDGISFTTTANSNVVSFNNGNENIFSAPNSEVASYGYNTEAIPPNGYQFTDVGPATASPWEPSDAVFVSGALAFGFMQYRRRRSKAAA